MMYLGISYNKVEMTNNAMIVMRIVKYENKESNWKLKCSVLNNTMFQDHM